MLAAAVFMSVGGLVLTPANAALIGPTPVALSGTPAPAGGNYSSFTSPVLNASGQVAYGANLTGGSSSTGIFAAAPGSSGFTGQAVALRGAAAPAGGNYDVLGDPLLNASGRVAFVATLTGGSSTSGSFVFAPGAGGYAGQVVAVQGTAAPGGGTYGSASATALNAFGQVAYYGSISGGSSGIFVGTPESNAFTGQAAVSSGTAAPAGGNYSFLGTTPVLNAAGQVAFRSDLAGGSSASGIFVGTPGPGGFSVQAAALSGTAAPAGGNYNGLNIPTLNASGQVAFQSTLTGGSSTTGIFAGAPGSVQAVALQGTAAPAGGNYNGFNTAPLINTSGQVALRATLTGGTSANGIFAGSVGSLQPIALAGAATPDGVGVFSVTGTAFAFNAAGQVAFTSSLTGAGVTTANDTGLYAGSAGNVVKIVREGDIIDIDPGVGVTLRTVNTINFTTGSGGEDGKGMSLNDDGLLVYRLTFTTASGGGSGVFTSQIVVPEPSALALLALGSFGLALRLAIRQRRPANRS